MTLINKYDPYRKLDDRIFPTIRGGLQDTIDSLILEKMLGSELDPVRVSDTVRFNEADNLTVEVDFPGFAKETTTVKLQDRTVYIQGTRKVVHKGGVREETGTRSFTIGKAYDVDKVSVEQKDGTLRFTVPKLLNQQVREIKIK